MNSQGDEDEKHPVTKHHNRPQTRERATRLARGAGLAACARAALFTAAAADAVTLFSNYDSPIFNSKFPSKNFNAAILEKYSVTTSQQNKVKREEN
ncbi:hypothetical protein MSG28_014030 [Choristoneura fumiferana]|uniref:Uncharacterized protein n=1 Tax=Choristoneura fumiferana TaxID=7141 RepID=A0ACC0JFP2_CHOFU|nr:hypothetical protein MSG28_014030 [Choristoneura fumiferana]